MEASRAAWRAAAAATADPRWAPPGPDAPLIADGTDGLVAGDQLTDVAAEPPADAREPFRRPVLPAALAAAAAGLTMASSTMTWATVRAFGLVEYSVTGMDDAQHGRLTFALGTLVGLAAVGLATVRRATASRLFAGVAGITGLVLALVALVDIGYLRGGGLFAGSGLEATTAIDPGLWLVLLGGLLAMAAALLARPRRDRAHPPWGRAGHPAGWQPDPAGTVTSTGPQAWARATAEPPTAPERRGPLAGAEGVGPLPEPERDTGPLPPDPRPGDADAGLMGS